MPENWKWKAWGTLLAALFSIYILIPSFLDVRAKIGEGEVPHSSWIDKIFPKKTLNLGLDLRGGLYLELDVDTAKARKNRLDLISTQVEQYLKGEDITVSAVTADYDRLTVKVDVPSESNRKTIELLRSQFEGVFETEVKEEAKGETATSLVFKCSESYLSYIEDTIIKQAVESVRNRVDRYGVAEANVQRQGKNRLVVEVPGEKDPERVIDLIRRTGQLEFRLVLDTVDPATLDELISAARAEKAIPEGHTYQIAQSLTEALKGKIPENSEILFEVLRDPLKKEIAGARPYLVEKKARVTGEMLKNAQVNIHDNRPNVSLVFDASGSRNFADLTKENVDKQLAIVLDGMISSAPTIDEPILSGEAEIRMGGLGNYQNLVKEAEDLALILREGALPSSMEVGTKTVIGPSLGRDSIRQGLNAILVASLVVLVFMILYYRWSGVLANVALVFNVLLLFALMAFMQASLSLPGLAGIVLTIGMAVDANIIIFERMREEMRLGKTARAVVESGYGNAMSAIIDSNITTFISGVVLYQFGTGPIKGFATTLMIGILTTLFTAIIFTRLIYDYFLVKKKVSRISV